MLKHYRPTFYAWRTMWHLGFLFPGKSEWEWEWTIVHSEWIQGWNLKSISFNKKCENVGLKKYRCFWIFILQTYVTNETGTQLLTMQNVNILIGKTYALSCAGTNHHQNIIYCNNNNNKISCPSGMVLCGGEMHPKTRGRVILPN